MYLVVDIGNTNIVFALITKSIVKYKWRVSTDINRTSDEYYILFSSILKNNFKINEIIIGSVVPEVTEEIKMSSYNYLKKKYMLLTRT